MALYILGIAICAAAVLQMGMWISSSLSKEFFNRSQLSAASKLVEIQIKNASTSRLDELPGGDWKGYREFYVDRLEKHLGSVTSVYLKPVDEKPIASFKPGQHLSFKFHVPGHAKPIVRCYSLSMGPGKDYYRISVKAIASPPEQPELPPGIASNFINHQWMEGDRVQVKAPSGSFFLDEHSKAPVILLAGGIGITPMLSMLEHLNNKSSDRLVVLFYGVRNSKEHTFKNRIQKIAREHPSVHVVNCYSKPGPDDQENIDYHVNGFVSAELIKQLLPNNRCQFYVCGPPAFMNSVRDGLVEWEVPESRILSEAFGPASIKKEEVNADAGDNAANRSKSTVVNFVGSEKQIQWSEQFDSILELAEANDVPVDSGCRAGSCGTCTTRVLAGKVSYPEGMVPECGMDECLPCVAKPNGKLELDI